MNGAEYIIQFLEKKGVDLVFGYPGGAVLAYDAWDVPPLNIF